MSKPRLTSTPLLWAVMDKTFHLVLTDECGNPFVYMHEVLANARCAVLNEGLDFPMAYVDGLTAMSRLGPPVSAGAERKEEA